MQYKKLGRSNLKVFRICLGANNSGSQLTEEQASRVIRKATDVAVVVGANDVTNPAARTRPDSPLFGMRILDVDKAKTVIFIKRSTSPGFAGVENELFYFPNTMMVFGDAKRILTELVASVSRLGS